MSEFTNPRDRAIDSMLRGEDKRFNAIGYEITDPQPKTEKPPEKGIFDDIVENGNLAIERIKEKFGLAVSAEETQRQATQQRNLSVVQDFMTKYDESKLNGTPLKPNDVKDIQTLYFTDQLDGDEGLSRAANAIQDVIDNPKDFGLRKGAGVDFNDYQKGMRGYSFTVDDGTQIGQNLTNTKVSPIN